MKNYFSKIKFFLFPLFLVLLPSCFGENMGSYLGDRPVQFYAYFSPSGGVTAAEDGWPVTFTVVIEDAKTLAVCAAFIDDASGGMPNFEAIAVRFYASASAVSGTGTPVPTNAISVFGTSQNLDMPLVSNRPCPYTDIGDVIAYLDFDKLQSYGYLIVSDQYGNIGGMTRTPFSIEDEINGGV